MRAAIDPSYLLAASSLVLALGGCQETGQFDLDSAVCENEVTSAQQELAEAMDTQQAYTPTDRVLSALDAEENFRGCGGTTSEINAAQTVTCQYLATIPPSQWTQASLVPTLQAQCCPSTVAGLQPWCSTYDAGFTFGSP